MVEKVISMSSTSINRLRFYDGRDHPIDKERLLKFEISSVINRFYPNRKVEAADVIDEIGPIHIDFTNIQHWSKEIPDIDERSSRLFTLWAEDEETNDVVLILRGFYVLVPLRFEEDALRDYYYHPADTPCFPMVVISAFRTIYTKTDEISEVLDRVKEEVEVNWQKLRQKLIDTLEKTDLWKRFVLSFDKIIYFSFVCPTIDRELIQALKMKGFRTTGLMQLITSPTLSYDQVQIDTHLKEAKKIVEKFE
jgi:hypothetical protein